MESNSHESSIRLFGRIREFLVTRFLDLGPAI